MNRDLREKIAELVSGDWYPDLKTPYDVADKILTLIPAIEGWEVEKECRDFKGCSYLYDPTIKGSCADKCQRSGTIRRQLTYEEKQYLIRAAISQINAPISLPDGSRIVPGKEVEK